MSSQATEQSEKDLKINSLNTENTLILNNDVVETSVNKKKKKKKKKKETVIETIPDEKPKKKGNSKMIEQIKLQKKLLEIKLAEEQKIKAEEEEAKRLYQLQLQEEEQKKKEQQELQKQLNKEKKLKQKERQKELQRKHMLERLGIDVSAINSEGNNVKKGKSHSKMYNKKKHNKKSINKHTHVEEEVIEEDDSNIPESWEDAFESDEEDEIDDNLDNELEVKEIVEEVKAPKIKAPICCILGNVDAGKTTFVDKIKSTQVQKHEAGGITQKINTIFVNFTENKYNVPGVILIDTPGHDSFYNLRSFGASLCNFVILMVDIMEGVKEQTIKSIELIKENKIPFVVVANKVDRINMWNSIQGLALAKSITKQKPEASLHFETLIENMTNQFSEQGLNVELNYRNNDTKTFASIYPVSSHTGEGIPDLFMGIMKLMTSHMKNDLEWKPKFEGVLTDINILKGLGKCINLLVYNGQIEKKDTLVLTGINGPVVKPITKLGIKDGSQFTIHDNIDATSDVSVVVKSSSDSNYIIGSPVYLISHKLSKKDSLIETNKASTAIDSYLKSKTEELSKKTSKYGVIVFASSFGGLTAITEYMEKNKIPYIDAKVGTIKKQDIVKLTGFNNRPETQIYNVAIAFDTNVDERALHECNINPNITLIQDNIIYRIFDQLQESISAKQGDIKAQYEKSISYPCILQILPEHIIARRKPIIIGVKVTSGLLKKGTEIQVLHKNKKSVKSESDLVSLGHVTLIKNPKGEDINEATINTEVSIQIDDTKENGKLYGRDFDATTPLWSKMTYDSRNIMMKYFYEDMELPVKSAFHSLSCIYGYERAEEEDSDEEYW